MSYLADKLRVAVGAQLLDKRRPGWHNDVRPDQLDMDSEEACVLGQLYGTFADGREQLFTASERQQYMLSTEHSASWHHGFTGRDGVQLLVFWRREIAARRLSHPAQTV